MLFWYKKMSLHYSDRGREGGVFLSLPPPLKKNRLKLNYFHTVESMMAKLSDFLLKVIWKHFKDVVTCSLILTLPWQPSFYSYVFSKITVLS